MYYGDIFGGLTKLINIEYIILVGISDRSFAHM